ncbi:WAT1-related protein [Prunus yedoensis var. nudiflora]|uniref:WAT1-related protein n=1 Tax=Prunus yedoensis var. nudiflora TaxID=2094558 RepID=A0A314YD36_PRUYE|nr:WAT1-related protein [Prunus yedoensis var. nudiflora]
MRINNYRIELLIYLASGNDKQACIQRKQGTEASSNVGLIMVMVEFLDVGLNILRKAAMNKGMSDFVFVVYANALAFFVLLPSSFFFYRRRTYPPLSWSFICKLFLLSFMSSGAQLLKFIGFIGINYSSPTMASAMIDLMPSFTFILAVITGMEILDLRITSRQAKCIGPVVSISGALMLTLYKGLPLIRADASHNKLINLQLLLFLSNELVHWRHCACISKLFASNDAYSRDMGY